MPGFNFEPFWGEVERLRERYGPEAVGMALGNATKQEAERLQNEAKVKALIRFRSVDDYQVFKEAYSDVIEVLASDSEPSAPDDLVKATTYAYRYLKGSNARPSFDATFMEIAGVVSKRGTCPRLRVGSVITVDNRIIATGYNGSPAGLPHCSEVGCLQSPCDLCHGKGVWELIGRPDNAETCQKCKGTGKAGGCKRTTHAEANALIQCARMGASPEDGSIYVTHRPCVACAGLIITAGISAVMYAGEYGTDGLDDEVTDMLQAAGVEVRIWSQ